METTPLDIDAMIGLTGCHYAEKNQTIKSHNV